MNLFLFLHVILLTFYSNIKVGLALGELARALRVDLLDLLGQGPAWLGESS